MRHSDIRVQQEVIDCLKKMNNEERTERLLEAINICNDKLKPQLVRTLSDAKERRVAHAFIGLLNNYTIFASQTRNDIIQEVCRYLPQYITEKTVPTLRDLIANASNDNSLHPETLQVINNAYAVLKETTLSPMERNLHASGFEEKEADVLPLTAEPLRKLRPPEDYALSKPKERGWFEHAISNPKLPSQLKKHMLRRKDLYCQLRHDEFLALSSLLSHKEYQAGQTLVAKGDVHSLLYFIEDGGVSIDFHDTKAKTAAMNLGMGDLIGHDVFMGGSEWHITLTAVRKTEVFLFDQEQLLYLQPSFSNLCSTILDYSKNNDVILRLYEAAVRDTICADNSGPVAFTGSGGDFLVDVAIHAMLPLGVCFCFSLPQGIDSSVFLDRELQVFMKTPAFSNHLVKAHIIGTRFLEENNRSLCIMARFLEEQPAHDSCRCLSISL